MQVTKVLDPKISSGMGKKGEWSQALVELDNGERVRIFNPIQEGQEVEAYINGEYTNYRVLKTREVGSSSNDDTTKALRFIAEQNVKVLESLDTLTAMLTDLSAKKPDTHQVTDEEMDEPIDLNQIPF